MSKPVGKTLFESLKISRSHDKKSGSSGYDRGMGPTATGNAQDDIQREVLCEMSQALRRSAEQVRRALDKLEQLERDIDDASRLEERHRLIEAFNEKRREAYEARRHYIIHREAIGFYRNDIVFEQFPIPPRRFKAGPNGQDGELDDACCADGR